MITPEQNSKELDELFEKYWATAPIFPIPEEHARHKIACRAAFLQGIIEGLTIRTAQ